MAHRSSGHAHPLRFGHTLGYGSVVFATLVTSFAFAADVPTLIGPADPGPIPVEVVQAVLPPRWSAVLASEVTRGDHTVAVLWPGFRDGVPLDDDVVAWVWTRQADGSWLLGDKGNQNVRSNDVISELLGGTDGQVISRRCGVPFEELAPRFNEGLAAFSAAVKAHDAAAAARAYLQIAPAFPDQQVLHDDYLPELLLKGPALGLAVTCEGTSCTMSMAGKTLAVEATPCRDGLVFAIVK